MPVWKAAPVTPAIAATLVLLLAAATIGGALTFQWLGYQPCELCYRERWPYYAALVLAPLAALAARRGGAGLARGALLIIALLFAGDAALSIYHSGVEWKIFAGPSDCSGPLTQARSMQDFLQQLQTVKVVRCDEPGLRVLGLTLANWNVVVSAALALLATLGARGAGAQIR
jgi:disulfide bond formation protein DsbB